MDWFVALVGVAGKLKPPPGAVWPKGDAGAFDVVYDAVSYADTLALGYALTKPGGDLVCVQDGEIAGRDDAGTGKRVHCASGLFAIEANHDIAVSLVAALPGLLESGAIKVRGSHLGAGQWRSCSFRDIAEPR